MAFKVIEKPIGHFKQLFLKNEKTGALVGIIPELGGRLNALYLEGHDQVHSLILGASDEHDINRSIAAYWGVKLFPFPNRLAQGIYTVNQRTYQFPLNEPERQNSLHGLVHQLPFKLEGIEEHTDRIAATLSFESDGTIPAYPFRFKLKVIYTLSYQNLTLQTSVENLESHKIPVASGWHPYISTGTAIDKLKLRIPGRQYLEVNERLLPTGNYIDHHDFEELQVIKDTCFDTCFTVNQEEKATTIVEDPVKNLRINIHQKTGKHHYNYIQYYTAEDRKSIAIEPLSAPPNALQTGIDLLLLEPGKIHHWFCEIELKEIN